MILKGEWHWECPNCTIKAISYKAEETPGHLCRGLRGLYVLMVPEGVSCSIKAVDREDYTNGDDVPTDGEGRPVMSVVTTKDDGQDCTVYAAVATAEGVTNGLHHK